MSGDDGAESASTCPSESDKQQHEKPHALREHIEADEDLLKDNDSNETDIVLTHCRIRDIRKLQLQRFDKLQYLCLRQNLISTLENSQLPSSLRELDLYDNLLSNIEALDHLGNSLRVLDLSFNKIKQIQNLDSLIHLEKLFLVQNKIRKIENIQHMVQLRTLELGGNKLREIENLEGLNELTDLWVGKNKISNIPDLSYLPKLSLLSIQANRLVTFGKINSLRHSLKELYISHNGLTSLRGIEELENLEVLDITANKIRNLECLSTKLKLRDIWAGYNLIDDIRQVQTELGELPELETVYFEKNPFETTEGPNYRRKLRLYLPKIKQIDATYVTA